MNGATGKKRKRKPKKLSTEKVTSESASSPATQKTDSVIESDVSILSQSIITCSPRTPRRSQRHLKEEICLTSTPVHTASARNLSNICPRVKQLEPKSLVLMSELETSEVESPPSRPETRNGGRRVQTSQQENVKRRKPRKQTQTSIESSDPPAKRQRGRKRRIKTQNLKECKTIQKERPRFELKEHDSLEKDTTLLSSDLSFELSQHEEPLLSLPLQEEEESEEEDELPSFMMQLEKKPLALIEGAFVWHKFRNYPFWPALVKNVNRKQKKASIMFIDQTIFDKKKGFAVALKSLKPFDCEESDELRHKAKEENDVAISWSLELIEDYRIRIACGSFSGSFVEYVAHDMSFPVRKKYPQESSEKLTIASDSILLEEACEDPTKEGPNEPQEEVSRISKRLLPDRTNAAHNRANEKLVHFIVDQRMVEEHLLAVIRRQQPSRWLNHFLENRRLAQKTYLEDELQLDRVYCYLDELYARASTTKPCPAMQKSTENVPFVMDVLLPEAIINAIAGVDKVPLEKAEEKYCKCRALSKREQEEFRVMIDRQIEKKSRLQNTKLALLSGYIR